MNGNWSIIALAGCLILLLVACSNISTPTLADETLPSPAATLTILESQKDSTPMTQPTPSPQSSGLENLIENAIQDLAQRLSVMVTEITLIEAKDVVWSDSSLGCPQPGMKYKQIPQDGSLIVLQAQGTVYEYHTGGGRELFLCDKISKEPTPPHQIDITNLTPQILDKNNPPPTTPDKGIPPGEDQ